MNGANSLPVNWNKANHFAGLICVIEQIQTRQLKKSICDKFTIKNLDNSKHIHFYLNTKNHDVTKLIICMKKAYRNLLVFLS